MKKWLAMTLLCVMCFSFGACGQRERSVDLMKDVPPTDPIPSVQSDTDLPVTLDSDVFAEGQMTFSVELLKNTAAKENGRNILISPLSVSLALSMAANGAQGETRSQMLQVLSGGAPLDVWNQSLYEYTASLTASKFAEVGIANSVWFRNEEVTVNPAFLQKAANYYGASAYKTPFDEGTVKDINAWVKKNTDGMIDEIVEKIDSDMMLYLINALVFESEWQNVYNQRQVSDGIFTTADGRRQKAEMMYDTLYSYLETDGAVGFVKEYKGSNFRFAALLPDEGTTAEDFAKTLTEEKLSEVLNNVQNTKVKTKLPKFSYDYSVELKDVLVSMGISDAFDWQAANFSEMGTMEREKKLFLNKVLHKTHIEVGEKGTRAAAVTAVEVPGTSAPPPQEDPKIVYLDRPFLFFIVDGTMNLPLFAGVVNSVE